MTPMRIRHLSALVLCVIFGATLASAQQPQTAAPPPGPEAPGDA